MLATCLLKPSLSPFFSARNYDDEHTEFRWVGWMSKYVCCVVGKMQVVFVCSFPTILIVGLERVSCLLASGGCLWWQFNKAWVKFSYLLVVSSQLATYYSLLTTNSRQCRYF